ncbi:hypothetical protein ATO12_15645 [Aquimarina atlantica]|uniref:Uncharacterized protein n=1 Tax=Aquimarina atlantica TaxID=1317122 RepID=A0A023BXB3_9FLAO|nr:hypothetical protein [Aquimarina atlantica]EZH74298.1 hypothetical protein ATO12_15645 [Aquimarina atlantica]
MEKHFELTDEAFKNQFTECTLNPEIFSHEAHLRLAWIMINDHGIEQAEKEMHIQLQHFVEFVGAKDKYNTTVTIVATKAVNHFMNQSKSDNFKDFIAEFPQLKTNFKQLINSHYSFDIFDSEKAKTEFLAPDILIF